MGLFNKFDIAIIILFFLIALGIWSIPSITTPILFGEGDAYWHYGQSDFIVESDYISSRLPYSYISKYFLNNKLIGPLSREYPPIIHINYANQILLGRHKFIPLGIFKAITSFLGFLGIYFLSRYLFSQTVAIISSFGILFSNRIFSVFLFGQNPTTIGIIFIPLILYMFYRIIIKLKEKENINTYLAILVLLLCSQFLLHLQALFISIILILVASCFFIIKDKNKINIKYYFSKKNLIFLFFLAIFSLIVIMPFLNIYLGAPQEAFGKEEESKDYTRIFKWGIDPAKVEGAYPENFILFKSEYNYIFLPFLILGIVFSIIKHKKNNYYFMISLLVGTYILLHADLWLGLVPARIARMLIFEPYIFWIFIAIGISFIISLIISLLKPFLQKNTIYLRYILIISVIILIYFVLGSPIKVNAKNAYPEIIRVNSDELMAAEWIKQNLPLNSHIFVKNDHISWRFYKYRFIRTMAHRPTYQSDNISKDVLEWNEKYNETNKRYNTNLPLIYYKYLLIDYSDYVRSADPEYQNLINQFKQYEKDYFEDKIPIYNNRDIIIYNITNMEIY